MPCLHNEQQMAHQVQYHNMYFLHNKYKLMRKMVSCLNKNMSHTHIIQKI